jgi:4'-phosphopantetheinyl transferase
MPLLVDKQIGRNSRLVLWEITESSEELLRLIALPANDRSLQANALLKKQRISTRILLKHLSPDFPENLVYDSGGKPYLRHTGEAISISHSGNLAGILLSSNSHTGLDIELIRDKIERIAVRFMSETELNAIDSRYRTLQLTTCWCAKEALYKFYGKKELLFREHLLLEPFTPGESGTLTGRIRTPELNCELTLGFEKIGNYMLVYVIDMV